MRNYIAKNVDEYIANASIVAQPKLNEMRALIRSAIPQAEEGISWGIPYYRHYGLLAGFSAFTKHISFGFNDVFSDNDRVQLENMGYPSGKRTVQIRFDQKIPTKMITKILKSKALLNEAKKSTK